MGAVEVDVVPRGWILDGFEVSEDIDAWDGVMEGCLDFFGEPVGFGDGPVAGEEEVNGHEAAGSGDAGAEGVVLDALGIEGIENGPDDEQFIGGQAGVHKAEHGLMDEADAGDDDMAGEQQAEGGVDPCPSGERDEGDGDDDDGGCPDVGHEVSGICFEGDGVVLTADAEEDAGDDEVDGGGDGGEDDADDGLFEWVWF